MNFVYENEVFHRCFYADAVSAEKPASVSDGWWLTNTNEYLCELAPGVALNEQVLAELGDIGFRNIDPPYSLLEWLKLAPTAQKNRLPGRRRPKPKK